MTEIGDKGVAVIEAALETMPANPGVYRMLDAKGEALYVGKARSLKRRVTSYTQIGRLPERLRRMVSETVTVEIVTTHTEAEALLLEANLIKRLKPRFNIVLRDDKSYPWLILTEDHPYPQIAKHRGAQVRKGSYWGPFASAWAVNQTVTAMQRVFLLRSCMDTVFSARHPPVPAVPDQTLFGSLRGSRKPRRIWQTGQPGQGLSRREGKRRPERTGERNGGGGRSPGIRTRRRHPRSSARPHLCAG